MTWIIDTKSKRRLSAKLAAGVAISAMLALGTFAAPANADGDGDHRGYHHNWNGGYYRAPPVVYGSPYGRLLRLAVLCAAGGLRPRRRHQLCRDQHRHSLSCIPIRNGDGRQQCRPFASLGRRTVPIEPTVCHSAPITASHLSFPAPRFGILANFRG